MAANRYYLLRSTIGKTLKSMKYSIVKNRFGDKELTDYINGIHKGILSSLRREARDVVDAFMTPRTIRIAVGGKLVGYKLLLLSDILGTINPEDIYPDKISDTIKNYLLDYASNITRDPSSVNPHEYIDVIVHDYLKLSEGIFGGDLEVKEEPTSYEGKLEVYLYDKTNNNRH